MPIIPLAELEASIRDKHTRALVSLQSRSRAPAADLIGLSWPCACRRHAVVFERFAGTDARSDAPARAPLGGTTMTNLPTFPALLERFFTQRLMQLRRTSPHTIR